VESITLPSKCDHVTVEPNDLLEWITWGGGGLGDPLTRPAEKVALEVQRKLVTFEGAAKNYGVVVRGEDYTVDVEATEALRKVTKEKRPESWGRTLYNRGGTLKELRDTCLEETGLPAPKPQWEKDPYGPHIAVPYVREWYEEMRKKGDWDLQ
jgi:5-oxoprolinase (ATP-hydrolysing)